MILGTLTPDIATLLHTRAERDSEETLYTFLQNEEASLSQITPRTLDRQARAIAAHLQAIAAPSSRILLLYSPGLAFISALFGCWYAGMIAVPVSLPKRHQTRSRWHAIVTDAQAEIVLTTQDVSATIAPQVSINPDLATLTWICSDQIALDQALLWQPLKTDPDTIALLQYTSGSTGTPKGVIVTHANLLHNSQQIQTAFQLTPESVSVSWLPHFHDMGLIDGILQPLYTGFQGILMSPDAFIQKPIRWLQAISDYQATHSGSPNQGYELCNRKITPEQCEELDLSWWHSAYSGAEPIRRETLERFAQKFRPYGFESKFFYPCYGMAEATLMISGGELEDEPQYCTIEAAALQQQQIIAATPTTQKVQQIVSVGKAWLETEIAIVNPETCQRCPCDTVGEIWVAGNSVAQGYWNRLLETQATFQACLATGEGPFLRTGDLGFMQAGELYVTGRLKDLIILWGRNHYPQDLELTVQQSHPAVRSSNGAAISLEVDGQEQLVVIQEVERSFLKQLPAQEIMQAIRQALSEQHDVQVYAIVLIKPASLPKTSSGKIQRSAARLDFLENRLAIIEQWVFSESAIAPAPLEPPTTTAAIETWLTTRLSQIANLPLDTVDLNLPFANYGLDSSLLLSLTGELSDWMNHHLMPTVFWEYPTIATLTRYLSDLIESRSEKQEG